MPTLTPALLAGIALGSLVLEGIALVAYRRRTGRGLEARALVLALLPGGFLMVALAVAIAEAGVAWLGAALVGALVAHVADLRLRYRAASSRDDAAGSS